VPKRLLVRLVETRKESVVVEVKTKTEWYRAVVPKECYVDGRVAEDDLKAGAYSVDWGALVTVDGFTGRLTEEMKVQGIFSFDELRRDIPRARAAISAAHGYTLASLLKKEN